MAYIECPTDWLVDEVIDMCIRGYVDTAFTMASLISW